MQISKVFEYMTCTESAYVHLKYADRWQSICRRRMQTAICAYKWSVRSETYTDPAYESCEKLPTCRVQTRGDQYRCNMQDCIRYSVAPCLFPIFLFLNFLIYCRDTSFQWGKKYQWCELQIATNRILTKYELQMPVCCHLLFFEGVEHIPTLFNCNAALLSARGKFLGVGIFETSLNGMKQRWHWNNASELNIGLFQFSSQISMFLFTCQNWFDGFSGSPPPVL
jgi:hypothetical protein